MGCLVRLGLSAAFARGGRLGCAPAGLQARRARTSAAIRTLGARGGGAVAALRPHWPLVSILSGAVILRAAAELAQRPALFWSDSWVYLALAFPRLRLSPVRPDGYSALLELLAHPGRSLLTVTVVQHAMGLTIGILAYALLLKLGMRRWLATAAAAVLLLDGYVIALEQHLMPEVATMLALTASIYLLIRGRGAVALLASGLLLAGAATMRLSALYLYPLWLLYLLWTSHGRRRAALLATVAAIGPLLGIAATYDHQYGTFSLTGSDGWFLYGRIGPLSRCDRAAEATRLRVLCWRRAAAPPASPLYYIFGASSPAREAFGPIATGRSARGRRANRLLREFAFDVIGAHPGGYAKLVGLDFLRFFEPGRGLGEGGPPAYELPAAPLTRRPYFNPAYAASLIPGYMAPPLRWPSALLRGYIGVVHTARWLLAALVVVAGLDLALGGVRRRPAPYRKEVVLLVGGGLLILALTAATAGMVLRYLFPALPLLVIGGALAVADLIPPRRSG